MGISNGGTTFVTEVGVTTSVGGARLTDMSVVTSPCEQDRVNGLDHSLVQHHNSQHIEMF
jgi:hypothetical protein